MAQQDGTAAHHGNLMPPPTGSIDGSGIVEAPQERIKRLASYGNMIVVDANMPIKRYYRSGMEMVRMATIYQTEGNLENAYILFMKFMTLFLEKILTHPEYKTYPAAAKRLNQERLRDVLPLAEKLRVRLLAMYEVEYKQYVAQEQHRRKLAQAQAAMAAAAAAAAQRQTTPGSKSSNNLGLVGFVPADDWLEPTAPPQADMRLDQVVYPNDFPSATNRSNQPSAGLLLPAAAPNAKPSFDRTLKPAGPADSLSLIEGSLRTVVVPGDTMAQFLRRAASNTAANVETCGILAGSMAQHKLMITHVILPKQKGTPDSCTTMCEEDIFDVQDQHNLITLGWIHTHPTQTAFLSSVDLHTHCSYQIMMPEAIAIVCAPKYNTTGFYSLTPDYGLDYIAGCRLSGFHPHPNEPPLFMDARHVEMAENTRIQVVDLR